MSCLSFPLDCKLYEGKCSPQTEKNKNVHQQNEYINYGIVNKGLLCSYKKEEASVACNTMEEFHKHNIEQRS